MNRDQLEKLPKKELLAIAKSQKLKKYSALAKAELVNAIIAGPSRAASPRSPRAASPKKARSPSRIASPTRGGRQYSQAELEQLTNNELN